MSRMRRGHRLHSISGFSDLETVRFNREESGIGLTPSTDLEQEFFDFINNNDCLSIKAIVSDPGKTIQLTMNWSFIKRCAKLVAKIQSLEILSAVLAVFTDTNPRAMEVGELFILEMINSGQSKLVLGVLQFWLSTNGEDAYTNNLEVIHTSIHFAASGGTTPAKRTQTLILTETAIYCATVDQLSEMLQDILQWHEDHEERVGQSMKKNADCMIHAALENDLDRLRILFSYTYRLGHDADERISKDYLKKIKLFKARASPVYRIVLFEDNLDIYKSDPLKKSFEYARQARTNADRIQDFTREYMDIAKKCEEFAKSLLDRCTTKHEVQTLLQTRSYVGHTDANFNIAILDGHKEFVAHEKFQQLLHKKWGQRDRLQWQEGPSYNIFWSEMTTLSKAFHSAMQCLIFLFLPLIYVLSAVPGCRTCFRWFIMHTQIPVNRFLYWEISKHLFYVIVILTLVDDKDTAWYDVLAIFWIMSYILENFRTIHRLYRFGGNDDKGKIFKRWFTFRNIYILSTDIVFLISLILRAVAYFSNQCRRSCPYEGNEIAFVAASIWSVAALLTFLRSIQNGLMWRQTGPVIISMSYMILDVFNFLYIFIIVYFAFTLSMVYVYHVYTNERTHYFNTYKSAFKLFFWAMIRTGNPQYADILVYNTTTYYNATCLQSVIDNNKLALLSTSSSDEDDPSMSALITPQHVQACTEGQVGGYVEEGIPYIAGNMLWAVYQFTVVIVLLSILRARMVNTYHRIFKEADVQWKYFRASIWWKYLDTDSVLPPPFTALYFLHKLLEYLFRRARESAAWAASAAGSAAGQDDAGTAYRDSKWSRRRHLCERNEGQRREFEKRYRKLVLMLISQEHGKVGPGAAS